MKRVLIFIFMGVFGLLLGLGGRSLMAPKVVTTQMLLQEFERVCLKRLANPPFRVPRNYTNLAQNVEDPFVVHNTYGARLIIDDHSCSLTAAPRMIPYSKNSEEFAAILAAQRSAYFPSLSHDEGFDDMGAAWAEGALEEPARWGVFYFLNKGFSEPYFMVVLPRPSLADSDTDF